MTKLIVGLVTFFSFSTAFCSLGDGSTGSGKINASSGADHSTISGGDIFAAVFFGSGPAAKYIQPLAQKNPQREAVFGNTRITDGQAQIIAKINQDQPGFLDSFAKDLTSGDLLKIRSALRAGIKHGKAAEEGVGKGSAAGYSAQASNFTSAAAVTTTVVTVGIVAATSTFTVSFSQNANELERNIAQDRYVIKVQRELAGIPTEKIQSADNQPTSTSKPAGKVR